MLVLCHTAVSDVLLQPALFPNILLLITSINAFLDSDGVTKLVGSDEDIPPPWAWMAFGAVASWEWMHSELSGKEEGMC